MKNFKAYPSEMFAEAEQLSSLSRQLLMQHEVLQKEHASMQPALKEAVGQEFLQALQGLVERQTYLEKQCGALRQVAEIYQEAELRCLDLNEKIGTASAAPAAAITAPGTPLRRGAVFNRDLLLDDWLAELVYTDQIRGEI